LRRAVAEEGPEVDRVRRVRIVLQGHQIGHAERAGDQHRLVVARRGLLADGVDQPDRLLEFALGQARFPDEGVQVLHERRKQLFGARVRRAVHLAEHRVGDVVLASDDHGLSSGWRKSLA
jgi:hypothetical protein